MTKRDDLQRRYLASAHAVQAGVQMEMNDDPPSNSGSPVSPREQELEQALERAYSALRGILDQPYGCTLCDSGTPRNPAKGHQPWCPYEIARAVIADQERQ